MECVVKQSSNQRIDKFIDKFCCWILALSPILQHYRGVFSDAGVSALIVLIPFISVKLLNKFVKKHSFLPLSVILPLIVFEVYKMIINRPSIKGICLDIIIIIIYLAIAFCCIDFTYFIKVICFVASCACVLLICQYIAFYIFDYHICCVPVSLFLPESEQWHLLAKTGLYGITGKYTGFYRPSAFFLEPSHLFIYCFPVLCYLLLSEEKTKEKIYLAIVVTLAMVLSTSGMGIFIACGIWGVFLCMYNDKKKSNIFNPKVLFRLDNIVLVSFALCICIMSYFFVDFVNHAVNRIFISDSGSTAIGGRTSEAIELVKEMSVKEILLGCSNKKNDIDFYMPGFFSTLYKYGIIGIILSYWFYFKAFKGQKDSYFWISFVIILISFFTAHTHGRFYMIYYVTILMNKYYAFPNIRKQELETTKNERRPN